MKKLTLTMFLCFILTLSFTSLAQEEKEIVNIVFTHDLHSHFESFLTDQNGTVESVGGFARIKTIIDQEREKDPNTLVVDAGDFSMGTLYQTIYAKEASELRMLGFMGFDATTLGNHELDYRDDQFAKMLLRAKESGDPIPPLVLSNIDWEGADAKQLEVKDAMDAYGVKPYMVTEKGGVKIAIMGIFGKQALSYSPMTELKFEDPVESAQKTVQQIKEHEDVDMIVCLSHSGTSEVKKDSEDEILAEKVPEIDLIISGHTHTTLDQPIVIGNTTIVSEGEYGRNLGLISLSKNKDHRWEVEEYDLVPMDKNVGEDQETLNEINKFKVLLQESYLDQYGYSYHEILAHNPYEFTNIHEFGKEHKEDALGNYIADSYGYAIKAAEGKDYKPIAVSVVPAGVVRDTLYKGDITVSQIFNISSLGVGADGIPGYPLIDVYLTGKELKTVAEVDASVSPMMLEARLYMSGLNFTFNPNRLILNRVTDTYLSDVSYHDVTENSENNTEVTNKEIIEDHKLYRVVADLYSGQMLSMVNGKSFGILSIVPKDENGIAIEDLESRIIYSGDKELKAWLALAQYTESFNNEDGKSEIPKYYSTEHSRKTVQNSKNIVELVKKPNKIAVIVAVVFLLLLGVISLVVRVIYKTIGKRRKR
ncbi:MAG TPA: bifunctional metallophosphatase/5'-nucleotidase [Candidatus Merdenecus merdavium]|nr:bifunctional metallophosphatase/5'-nucleotidase [Candidatus Merdenecus merdavium]